MRLIFCALILTSIVASPAGAELTRIEIQLPELYGHYWGDYRQAGTRMTTSVEVDPAWGEIQSVGFRVTGVFEVGTARWPHSGEVGPDCLMMTAVFPTATTEGTLRCPLDLNKDGGWILEDLHGFEPFLGHDDGVDWGFLHQGLQPITLDLRNCFIMGTETIEHYQSADIHEAALILWVDTVTPVDQKSWGTIKGLYR